MRYLLVLDQRSPSGSLYAAGNNDGFVQDREHRHPVLDCVELLHDSPYYVYAKREFAIRPGTYQSLYIPHNAVVLIMRYAQGDPTPFGFTRTPYGPD